MRLKKDIRDLKKAILVPCYRRPEYTRACLKSLFKAQSYQNTYFQLVDDGSEDDTGTIMSQYESSYVDVIVHFKNLGLRQTIINFFNHVRGDFDIIAKMDNDCCVPENWLDDVLKVFEGCSVDILSPNVYPSNAAFKYGQRDEVGNGYRPTNTIGGLWVMHASLLDNMFFEEHDTVNGIKGAIPLLRQIVAEKDPIMGWVPSVVVQDIGHWSGVHPDNIKTREHEEYYMEIGRQISWSANEGGDHAQRSTESRVQKDKEVAGTREH